jgi:hypothetical protein
MKKFLLIIVATLLVLGSAFAQQKRMAPEGAKKQPPLALFEAMAKAPYKPGNRAIVYQEGFESTSGTALPTGWTVSTPNTWETNTDVYYMGFGAPGEFIGDDFEARTGSRMFGRSWNKSGNTWAFSAGFPLTSGETYTVSFYFCAPGYAPFGEVDDFEVKIGNTPTASGMASAFEVYKQVGVASGFPYTWTLATKNFTPSSSGTYYLGFHDLNPSGGIGMFIVIDDILIEGGSATNVTITTSANPTGGGVASPATQTVPSGTSVTVTAMANTGFNFVNWTKDAAVVSTTPSYTFSATATGHYVANFQSSTPGDCNPPTALNVVYTPDCKANLTWTAPTGKNRSTILWDNTNINVPTSGNNGLITSYWAGANTWVYTADDFVADAAWTIEKIYTKGFPSILAPNPTKMAVVIYQDNANKPGTQIYSNYAINVTWVSDPDAFYSTEITLPTSFTLPASGKYWIALAGAYDGAVDLDTKRWNIASGITGIGTNFHLHDPGNLFGMGTNWFDAGPVVSPLKSSYFKIEGTAGAASATYNVFRDGSKVNTAPVTTESYTDQGFNASTGHLWEVKAICSTGGESNAASKSMPACNVLPGECDPPQNLTVNYALGCGTATVKWDAPDGKKGKTLTPITPAPFAPVTSNASFSASGVNIAKPKEDRGIDEWLKWSGATWDGIGNGSLVDFICIARYTPADLAANDITSGLTITKVRFVPYFIYDINFVTIYIYQGGTSPTNPGTLLYEQPVTQALLEEQNNDIILNEPFVIDADQELWVGYRMESWWYSAGCDFGPRVTGKGDIMYWNGTWTDLWGASAGSVNGNWNIEAFIEGEPMFYNVYRNGNPIALNYTKTTYIDNAFNAANPHKWEVAVACPDGGESGRIDQPMPACNATPPGTCEPAQNLAVSYTTDCTTASLTWEAPVGKKANSTQAVAPVIPQIEGTTASRENNTISIASKMPNLVSKQSEIEESALKAYADAYVTHIGANAYCQINLTNGNTTPVGSVSTDPFPTGEDFDDTDIYRICENAQIVKVGETGAITNVGFISGISEMGIGLAYDWVANDGTWYFMDIISSGGYAPFYQNIYKLTLPSLSKTLIGTTPTSSTTIYRGLSIAQDGTLYSIANIIGSPANLVKINKTNGQITVVGSTGVVQWYGADLSIDRQTGIMYAVIVDDNTAAGLFGTINPSTGNFTQIKNVGAFDMYGTVVVTKHGNLNLAKAPSNITLTPDGVALAGTFSWTNPTQTLAGTTLPPGSITQVVILRDGAPFTTSTTNVNPGGTYSLPVTVTTAGAHTFAVYVVTSQGSSPQGSASAVFGDVCVVDVNITSVTFGDGFSWKLTDDASGDILLQGGAQGGGGNVTTGTFTTYTSGPSTFTIWHHNYNDNGVVLNITVDGDQIYQLSKSGISTGWSETKEVECGYVIQYLVYRDEVHIETTKTTFFDDKTFDSSVGHTWKVRVACEDGGLSAPISATGAACGNFGTCNPATNLQVDYNDPECSYAELTWDEPVGKNANSYISLPTTILTGGEEKRNGAPNNFDNNPDGVPGHYFETRAWDLIHSFTWPPPGTDGITGMATDGNYVYVTRFSGNTIYKLNMDGTTAGTFTIPGIASLRALTYDGTNFYGSNATNQIWQLNMVTPAIMSTITLPSNIQARHCTYDPTANGGAGGFWVGNWTGSPSPDVIFLVSKTGTLLQTIPAETHGLSSIYGTAFDNITPDGPYLWAIEAYGIGDIAPTHIRQIKLSTGLQTGVNFNLVEAGYCSYDGVGGGLFLEPTYFGQPTLMALVQNEAIHGFAFPCATCPAPPTAVTLTPDGTTLNGTLTWTNPNTTFSGAPLTSITKVVVLRNNQPFTEITTGVTPGAPMTLPVTVLNAGTHSFSVYAVSTAGDGSKASASAVFGNVCLVEVIIASSNYGDDWSWKVTDDEGVTIIGGGQLGSPSGANVSNGTFTCLIEGEAHFKVWQHGTFGDNNGYVTVKLNGDIVYEKTTFPFPIGFIAEEDLFCGIVFKYNIYRDGGLIAEKVKIPYYKDITFNAEEPHTWAVKVVCPDGLSEPVTANKSSCWTSYSCDPPKNLTYEQWEDCRVILNWEKPDGKTAFNAGNPLVSGYIATPEEIEKAKQEKEMYAAIQTAGNAYMDACPKEFQSKETEPTNSSKAMWDVEFMFDASAAAQVAIGTDGTNFYTANWQPGNGTFSRYSMTGAHLGNFTIPGVTEVRCLTYDGTHFYAGAAATIRILDLANQTQIGTIPNTGGGNVRHLSYDPNLNGGAGGFWLGDWATLRAISKTGTILHSNVTVESVYGSAYDPYSNPGTPYLWLHTQRGSDGVTIGTAILEQFDITTRTLTGVQKNVKLDYPNPSAVADIAGGACAYASGGKYFLCANVQKDPNLILVYELATLGTPCPAVTNVNATVPAGTNNVVVTWTAATGGPIGYEVRRNGNLLNTVTSTSYTDNNVIPPGVYTYSVKAVFPAGNDCIPVNVSAPAVTVPEIIGGGCDAFIIGTGTSTGYNIPLNTFYCYSYTQQIYDAADLTGMENKDLTSISFEYIYSTPNNKNPLTVYLAHTSKNTFSGNTDWEPVGTLTQVYTGNVTFDNTKPWYTIHFDQPFRYNGGNLVVAVLNNHGTYTTSSNPTFRHHSVTGNKTLQYYKDGNPVTIDPANISGLGSATNIRSNVRFIGCTPIRYNVYVNGSFLDFIEGETYTDFNSDYTIENEYCVAKVCDDGTDSKQICVIVPPCTPTPCAPVENLEAEYGLDCQYAKITWQSPILPIGKNAGNSTVTYPVYEPDKDYGIQMTEAEKLAMEANNINNAAMYARTSGLTIKDESIAPKAMWSVLYSYDFTSTETGFYAPFYYNNKIYATRWNPSAAGNAMGKIYRFNISGDILTPDGSVTVPGITGTYNLEDFCTDGTYFYSANETGKIFKIDPTTWTLVSTINVPISDVAPIAYDKATGGFWIASMFGNSVTLVTATGTSTGTTLSGASQGIMGLAYDDVSPGGPYVWASVGSSNTTNIAQIGRWKVGVNTFTLMHNVALDPPVTSSGNSMGAMFEYERDGMFSFVALSQGQTTIFGYEIALTGDPCPAVTNVTAAVVAGTANVKINWNTVAGAISQEVTRDGATIATLGTTANTYTDATATPGSHTYCVKAIFPASADCVPVAVCAPAVTVPELFGDGCEGKQVISGDGTTSVSTSPMYTLYGCSYNQLIFTEDELGLTPGKTISNIAFNYITTTGKPVPIKIFIGHTTKTQFDAANAAEFIPLSQLTMVYDDTKTLSNANTWLDFQLTESFEYQGGNLVIAVHQYVGDPGWYSSSFLGGSTSTYKNLRTYQDPYFAPGATGSSFARDLTRANIRFIVCEDQKEYNIYRDGVLVGERVKGYTYIDEITDGFNPTEDHCWTVVYLREGPHYLECEPTDICLPACATSPCNDVIVGAGTATGYEIPVNTFYCYSFTEQIYDASEIGANVGDLIKAIGYEYILGTANPKNPVTIYIGQTPKTTFDNINDWIPVAGLTQVYHGALNFNNANKWYMIDFDTPYPYTGGNLVVAVLNNHGTYNTGSTATFRHHTTTGSNKTLHYRKDGNPVTINPDALPAATAVLNIRNNTLFDICEFIPENDMAATNILVCPSMVKTQTPYDVDVTVKNMGVVDADNYTVEILSYPDFSLIATDGPFGPLAPGATFTHTISNVYFNQIGDIVIRGRAVIIDDANPVNNQTPNFNLNVRPKDDDEVVEIPCPVNVGTPQQTIPFDFYWTQSLVQSIYTEAEIGLPGGFIKDITWFYDNTATEQTRPVKVFFAITDKTTLSGGWIPYSEFTKIYEGNVTIPPGKSELKISLAEPFLYMGDNLVVMTSREYNPPYVGGVSALTTVVEPVGRTRRHAVDTQFGIETPPPGATLNYISNIRLTYYIAPAGVVQGTASCEGIPEKDVKVTLTREDGFEAYKTTDAAGFYKFGYVPIGNWSMLAEKFPYYDGVVPPFDVANGITYIKDFTALCPLPEYTVFGAVEAADGTTLIGAKVKLEGYENYSTETNDWGAFDFPYVYAPKTYTLTITHPCYQTHTQIVPVTGNTNLGTIIMYEVPYKPIDVVAVEVAPHVNISWNEPEICEPGSGCNPVDFRYDSGVMSGQLGFNTEFPRGVMGACHRVPAELYSVQWFLTDNPIIPQTSVSIYVFDLDASGQPTNTILHSEVGVPTTIMNWNNFEFSAPVIAPNGFFLAMSRTVGAFLALGTATPTAEYPFLPNTNFYSSDYLTVPYVLINQSDFDINFMLRAVGCITGKSGNYSFTGGYETAINEGAELTYIESATPIVTDNPAPFSFGEISAARGLLGYKLWRLKPGQEGTPEVWSQLTNVPVPALQYTDISWPTATVGDYKWAVRTCYHGAVESEAAFSNVLYKNIEVQYTVQVSTNSGDAPTGALVKLSNAGNTYEQYTPSTGTVTFAKVWCGSYTLTVSLAGYQTHTQTLVITDVGGTTPVLLIEIINDPFDVAVETENCGATLTWNHIDEKLLGFTVYLNGNPVKTLAIEKREYVFNMLPDGDYTAGIEANYKSGNSNIVTKDFSIICIGISGYTMGDYILYPSPADNKLYVERAGETEATIELFNAMGMHIAQYVTTLKKFEIDVTALAAGTYFVRVADGDKTGVKGFVKK